MFESIKRHSKNRRRCNGGRSVPSFGGCCSSGGGTKRQEDEYKEKGEVKKQDNTSQNSSGIQRTANICNMVNMLRRIGK